MAKTLKVKAYDTDFNGNAVAQDFTPLRVQHQVGDKFYIPKEALLLILGTAIPAQTRDGAPVLDEKGNPTNRTVGQHFPAVRIVNGQPTEAVELYVGQIVKVDVNQKVVFNGELAGALRKGSDDFKKAICGKVLEITEEAECPVRIWDGVSAWVRNEDDSFASQPGRALKFEAKASPMGAKEIEAAEGILVDYINETYAELVTA